MSDFSLTTFSSKGTLWGYALGKLPQIENALAAVAKGETSLGIKATDGVVIATEKKLSSPLMDQTSINKIQLFATHIAGIYSGLGPDFRQLCQKTRKLVQKYVVECQEEITTATLCREASNLIQ